MKESTRALSSGVPKDRVSWGVICSTIALAVVFYLVLTRFPFVVISLKNNIFSSSAPFQKTVTYRTFYFGVTVVSWILLSALITRGLARIRVSTFVPTLLLGLMGWGIIVVLGLTLLGLSPNSFFTGCALIFPILVFLGCAAIGKKSAETLVRENGTPRFILESRSVIKVIGIVIVFLFTLKVIDAFLWLPLHKGVAQGDEAFFWWSSTETLKRLGWTAYLTSYPQSNYDPGYPLLGNLLTAFTARSKVENAGLAIPFLYGAFLVWLLFESLWSRRSRIRIETWAFYSLLGGLLFFYNSWISAMIFQLWYAEVLGILSVACTLIVIYGPDLTSNENLPRNRFLTFIELAGVGVVASLSKPPLSVLIVPAVLPTLFVSCLFQRKGERRKLALRVLYFSIGCVLAKILWRAALNSLRAPSFYSFTLADILSFDLESIRHTLLPYFFLSYKHVWLLFGLTAVAGLSFNPRKYAGPLMVSTGLSLSIFILYGSIWKTSEYESSVRYLLHGMYGWTLYYFITMTHWIDDCFGRLTSIIHQMIRRFACRSPS